MRAHHRSMKAMAAALLAAPLTAATPALAAPDDTALTRDILARVRHRLPMRTIEISGPLSLRVSDARGEDGEINLDRLAAFCAQSTARECRAQKERFVTGIVESMSTDYAALTRERLRVVVRNDDYAAAMNAQSASGATGRLVMGLVAPGLNLVLAADYPDTTRLVGENDLKSLGLSRDESIALGTRQVLATIPALPGAGELGGAIVLLPDLDYGAAAILATDHWRKVAKDLPGVLWIAVPGDQHVLMGQVTRTEDLEQLKPVIAKAFTEAPRGISPTIFRWAGDGWVPVP